MHEIWSGTNKPDISKYFFSENKYVITTESLLKSVTVTNHLLLAYLKTKRENKDFFFFLEQELPSTKMQVTRRLPGKHTNCVHWSLKDFP